MPLFEYRCRDCEKRFEEIVLGDAKPRCPSCESRKVEKLLSVFAVGNGGGGEERVVGARRRRLRLVRRPARARLLRRQLGRVRPSVPSPAGVSASLRSSAASASRRASESSSVDPESPVNGASASACR